MPTHILNIETTTTQCSVALATDGQLVGVEQSNHQDYQHSKLLHTYIHQLLQSHSLTPSDLSAVAVSSGPGSYTGLRIGVGAAKGLCFGCDIPLIALPTLVILAQEIQKESGYILPVLDARRDEVYVAVYDTKHNLVQAATPHVLSQDSFTQWANQGSVFFVGTGIKKCKRILAPHQNLYFPNKESFPSATHMVALSYQKYQQGDFEDLAYFDPEYLKSFQVTPSKKDALGLPKTNR
ncbi:MAG: tRNA (adenosine(37)-N6)-threonylcarbamoyltransferase complex dimerization subunit type 1 TsaB [Flavobacteriaceae bacterium]